MQTHLNEDDLVLHYYGEMPAAEDTITSAHLNTCAECHAKYRRLQRVLAVLDDEPLAGPQLPEHFERTVWARLEPNLRRERTNWFSWFVLSPARLALVATVVLLVGVAFLAGRLTPRGGEDAPVQAETDPADMRERILLVDLDEHLDRSQMVLVELVTAGAASFASERDRAEHLVSANRLYRRTASTTGDAAIVQLLDELERVLVEVATAPEDLSERRLERMRRRIDDQDLLFKLRVVSSELRERQRPTTTQAAGRRSSL